MSTERNSAEALPEQASRTAPLAAVPRPIFRPVDYVHGGTFWAPSDPRRHDPGLIRSLRGHIHGRPRFRRCRYGGGCFVYVTSPDDTALAIFALRTTWRVAGLELARDWFFLTQADADAMKRGLVHHLIKTHSGLHIQRRYMNSDYWGKRRPGRSCAFPVVYSDQRPNSRRRRPRAHLEMRFHGRGAVRRRLGVKTPGDLLRRKDELLRFWDRNLDLRGLDFAKAGRDHRNRQTTGPRRRGFHPDDADVGRGLANLYGRRQGGPWSMQAYVRNRGIGPEVVKLELPRGLARIPLNDPTTSPRLQVVKRHSTPTKPPNPAGYRPFPILPDHVFQPHHPPCSTTSAQAYQSRAPP